MLQDTFLSRLSIALLSLAVLAVAATAVTGAAPVMDEDQTNASAKNASASFDSPVVTIAPNETAEVSVSLTATDSARLRFGSANTEYHANVTVTDGNDDGTVVLVFDAESAGEGGAAFATADDADSVTVSNETSFEAPGLSPANLPVFAVVNGTTTGEMTFLVREQMDRNSTTTAGEQTTVNGTTTTTGQQTAGNATTTANGGSTATPTGPTETTTDEGDATTTEADGGNGPGFGIATTLLALVGAALIARRR